LSTKTAVTLVSRALAIYLLAWFVSDFTYLPPQLFSLFHYANRLNEIGGSSYSRDWELISLASRLVRMVLLFFGIQWFYRSGPAIQQYLLAPEADDPDSSQ